MPGDKDLDLLMASGWRERDSGGDIDLLMASGWEPPQTGAGPATSVQSVEEYTGVEDAVGGVEAFGIGMGKAMLAPAQAAKQSYLEATDPDNDREAPSPIIRGHPLTGPMRAAGEAIKYAAQKLLGATSPGEAEKYRQELFQEQEAYEKLKEKQPFATGAGELAGDVVVTAPLSIGSPALAGGRAAAAVGRGATEGMVAGLAQPVTGEGDFASQKLKQAVGGAAIGGAVTKGLHSLANASTIGVGGAIKEGAKALKGARDSALTYAEKFLKETMDYGADAEYLAKGVQLARGGLPLTFGQQTGAKVASVLERFAAESGASADVVNAVKRESSNKLRKRLNVLLNKISRPASEDAKAGKSERERVGDAIRNAYTSTVEGLKRSRSEAASRNYAAVDASTNGEAIIPFKNAIAVIDEQIAEHSRVADVVGEKIVKSLESHKRLLLRKETGVDIIPPRTLAATAERVPTSKFVPKEFTATEVSNTIRDYGRMANGDAAFLGAEAYDSQGKRLAAMVQQAMLRDVDEAAEAAAAGGGAGAEAGKLLKIARNDFYIRSLAIEEVAESTFSKLFGNKLYSTASGKLVYDKPAEAIADHLGKMEGSQVRATVAILKKYDPDVLDEATRYLFEKPLMAEKPVIMRSSTTPLMIKADEYLKNSVRPEVARELIDKKTYANFVNVNEALIRWAKTEKDTAASLASRQQASNVIDVLVAGSRKAVGKLMAKAGVARRVAYIMADTSLGPEFARSLRKKDMGMVVSILDMVGEKISKAESAAARFVGGTTPQWIKAGARAGKKSVMKMSEATRAPSAASRSAATEQAKEE